MEFSETDNEYFVEEVQALSQLTNYPPAMINDIIRADRMYTLDRICDDMKDKGELPERYSFKVPGYGEIKLRRLTGGQTTNAQWSFMPSQEFINGFFNAFYYDISPIYDRVRYNFSQIMESRKNNLLNEDS